MNITHLVGIHETLIAHHIAPVGQIHGQNGSAAIFDGRVPVPMDMRRPPRMEIPAKKQTFHPFGEIRICREDILKGAVLFTNLAHQHTAALFHNLSLDASRVFPDQCCQVNFVVQDLHANFGDTTGTKRIGGAGKTKRRGGPFRALEHLSRRPARGGKLTFRNPAVDCLENFPGQVGCSR